MEPTFTGKEFYAKHFVPKDFLESYYTVSSGNDADRDHLTFFLKNLHRIFTSDCLLSSLCLDAACKDIPTYQSAFRNILKPGGHLLLYSTLEGYYYTMGQHKFSSLYLEKEMVEEAVRQAGFVIKWFEETSINFPPSSTDVKKICILLAQKCSP